MAPRKREGKVTACENEWGEDDASTRHLSDHALSLLLEALPTRSLLSVAALVCRRWRRLSRCCPVREVGYSLLAGNHDHGPCSSKGFAKAIEENASDIEVLGVSCVRGLSCVEPEAQLPGLPPFPELLAKLLRLRRLALRSLRSCHEIGDLDPLLQALPPGLEQLAIVHDWPTVSLFDAKSTPWNFDLHLGLISSRCPKLKRLELVMQTRLPPEGIDALLGAPAVELEVLRLWGDLEWRDIARVFERYKGTLQEFWLTSGRLHITEPAGQPRPGGGDRPPPPRLSVVPPPSLTSLGLCDRPGRSVSWCQAEPAALLLACGEQLRALHAPTSFSSSWQMIATWCPGLTALDLSQQGQSPLHEHAGAMRLTKMEEVVLGGLLLRLKGGLRRLALPASASDRLLFHLRSCPALAELRYVEHKAPNGHVSDMGIRALAENCSQLRALSIQGSSALTVAAMRDLAFHCRQLEFVQLGGSKLDDGSIAALLPNLHSTLQVLDVTGCSIQGPQLLQALLSYAQARTMHLRALGLPRRVLQRCRNAVKELKQLLPHLSVRSNSFADFPTRGFLLDSLAPYPN